MLRDDTTGRISDVGVTLIVNPREVCFELMPAPTPGSIAEMDTTEAERDGSSGLTAATPLIGERGLRAFDNATIGHPEPPSLIDGLLPKEVHGPSNA